MIILYKRYKNKYRVRGKLQINVGGVLHLKLGNNVKININNIFYKDLKVGSLKIGDHTQVAGTLNIIPYFGYADVKIGSNCYIENLYAHDLSTIGKYVIIRGTCIAKISSKIQNRSKLNNYTLEPGTILTPFTQKKFPLNMA